MAYRAEIEIGVKGAKQLEAFNESVNKLSRRIANINKQEVFGTKQVTSVNEYNAALRAAEAALNNTRLQLDSAGNAARTYKAAIEAYVTALGAANERQSIQNNLIQQEINSRNAVTAAIREQVAANVALSQASRAASGFGAFSASLTPTPTEKAIRRNRRKTAAARAAEDVAAREEEFNLRTSTGARAAARRRAAFFRQQRAARAVRQINAVAGPAQLLLPPAAPGSPAMSGGARRRITGPVERLGSPSLSGRGARTVDQAQMALRQYDNGIRQATTGLTSQARAIRDNVRANVQKSRAERRAVAETKALNAALAQRNRLERRLNKRGLMQLSTGKVAKGVSDAGFGMQGPALPPLMVDAKRGGMRGALAKAGGLKGAIRSSIPGALVSLAFPLLTGQPIEGAIGGGIGGLLGGVLGSVIPGVGTMMGGFAGGLLGSYIGDLIGDAKKLTKELEQQQAAIGTLNRLEDKRSMLTVAIATAQQRGNKELAVELEGRRKNAEIAQKLYETRQRLLADDRNKTKEGRKQLEFEEKIAEKAAFRLQQENNRLTALQLQALAMEKQLKLSDRQNESVQRRLQTTSKLIGFAGETIAAGGSAAQAIGTARVSELERIAARTQNPLEQANLQAAAAKEIAAAAERAYQIRLLDIELSQMQLKIEHKIQQSKLAQVVAQAKIAKANKMDAEALSAYEDAIEAQRSAVDVSQAAVLAGEAKAQFARSQAAAEYSQKLQGVVERLDKARDLANSVGGEASKAARGIQDIAVYTARASAAALNLAESWFRAGSAISGAMQKMAGAAAVRAGVMKAPAPVAPTSRGYAEVNGVRTYFAEGGFVTRPTNAMVGEGGQPEYVIPASKMNDAMRRYSAGTRGEAVVNGAGASGGMSSTTNYSNQQNAYYGSGGGTSVNITTGPVMRLGNKNYVTVTDMQRGMAAAVGAAEANMMSRMSRSYAARRSMGL